ncbi:long-chain fatty acid--CoA ligase, partial [Myxococcota bacterium]|nr:long-chain fatty acid--CoA ligase [Myxococcota bacterium]
MSALKYKSVAEMILKRVEASSSKLAFQYPDGESWAQLTWKQAGDRFRFVGCGLLSMGLKKEERVAILSATRMDWITADYGVLTAAGATTTIYPSNTPDECAYIINDSESRFLFAEDDDQIAKLVEKRDELKSLEKVITFDGKAGHDGWVITLDELEEMGRVWDSENPGAYEKAADSVEIKDLATIIYTSGTTGTPKGVELLQEAWVYEATAISSADLVTEADHQYLWLPLSHSFGKVMQVLQLDVGFPTTVDGRIPKLVDNLAVIRPTVMAAAPRIFEKVHNKVVAGVREAGGAKLKIFQFALKAGREMSAARQAKKSPSLGVKIRFAIADKLVFSKLREKFGGRMRFFISGSAPLSKDMAEFFHAADLLIIEGYGLTETSAATFVNRPYAYKFGTVGLIFKGSEFKIAEEDGEILIKGPAVMRGYHNLPEVTKESFTDDGWFRTGDIGEKDKDGFLKITDRKKDLIKTSGGKYIAPQSLESKLKAKNPYLGNVIVHGDRRNFCSALLTL